MKKLILGLMAGLFFISVSTANAAGSSLVATYTVASETTSANGMDMTLNLMLHNPDQVAITSATLQLDDPMLMATVETSAITVSNIPANGGLSVNWTLSLQGPPMMPGQTLMIRADGSDANGTAFNVIITGVAQ